MTATTVVSDPVAQRRMRLIPMIVACPLFLQNLDTSIMATALPSIGRSLQVDVLHLNLAITAYLLSLAIAIPASGWMAERFGARRLFCAAIVLFAAASAACGAAQTLDQLVVYRLMQGVGGAMMVPVGRLILLRSVPPTQLLAAMVWFTLPPGIGRMIGPLFGGAIVSVTSWRWIFFVNVPISLAIVAAAWMIIQRDPDKDPNAAAVPFDTIGFFLLAVGLVCVLGPIELTGRGWIPWWLNGAIVLSGFAALYGYLRHARTRRDPLLDLSIYRSPTYRHVVLGAMPVQIVLGAAPFLLPLLFQLGFDLSPAKSGLLTVGLTVGALCSRPVLQPLIRSTGYRTAMVTSATLTAVFTAACALLTPTTPHAIVFGMLMVSGLATSITLISASTLGYADIARDRMSHATTGSAMTQQVSLSIGVVIGAAALSGTAWFHGHTGGTYGADDFWPAFLLVGLIALLALPNFRKIQRSAGRIERVDVDFD